ncbi:MAG: type III pantothenate kinase [Bacteroidales bacterium]|jgi:type III pantothenate kinase|nr:type III pantothenate kinase [Bacteroidales bacterium]
MNLVFDIGNSGTKMALYDGRKKITSFRTKEFSCERLHKKMSHYQIDKAIVCSVRDIPEFIFDLLTRDIPFIHVLSHESKLPFRNEYETPETLGPDRIAAVAGAYELFKGEKVLIIDAGSAITYDFLSGKSYKGGNISPGLRMRFKALHKFTGKLPLVDPEEKYTSPGKNTSEAITAGVINGVTYEINEYIRTFEKKHVGINVILSGGDSEYLKGKINHRITYVPDIVVDGLNYILEYNAK